MNRLTYIDVSSLGTTQIISHNTVLITRDYYNKSERAISETRCDYLVNIKTLLQISAIGTRTLEVPILLSSQGYKARGLGM